MAPEDIYEESRNAYTELAAGYGISDGAEVIDSSLLELLTERLAVGSHVLDLGSGPGQYSRRLSSMGYSVVALDNNPAMISELTVRGCPPNVKPVLGDMRSMDFAAQSFDGVLAIASLIHLLEVDLAAVLAALYSVLKADGIMLATFAISDKGVRFERKGADEYATEGRFFQHYSSSDIPLRHLTDAGFRFLGSRGTVLKPLIADGAARGRIEWVNFLMARAGSS